MSKEKHYRNFGPVTLEDKNGNVKEIRSIASFRINPNTKELILDDEGLPREN